MVRQAQIAAASQTNISSMDQVSLCLLYAYTDRMFFLGSQHVESVIPSCNVIWTSQNSHVSSSGFRFCCLADLSSMCISSLLHCLHSRNPLLASDGVTPPPQSCSSTVSNPPDMSGWNPFGEDNFSKLTEEELIDREFDMLRASKGPLQWFWSFCTS